MSSFFPWLKTQAKNPRQGSLQARVMGLYWKLVRKEEVAPDWLDNPSMTDMQRYSIASFSAGAIGGAVSGLRSAFGIVLHDGSAMVLLGAAAGKLFKGGGGPKAAEAEATVLCLHFEKEWAAPDDADDAERAATAAVLSKITVAALVSSPESLVGRRKGGAEGGGDNRSEAQK